MRRRTATLARPVEIADSKPPTVLYDIGLQKKNNKPSTETSPNLNNKPSPDSPIPAMALPSLSSYQKRESYKKYLLTVRLKNIEVSPLSRPLDLKYIPRRKPLKDASQAVGGSQKVTDQNPYEAVTKYGNDLTELARRGELDPVIGRDDEIEQCITILSERIKNNPVIVGDPGDGRTAIAHGVAQRIACGDVTEHLKNCKLISLDTNNIGDFEERLKAVEKAVTASNGQLVLFIDDIRTVLVGAGNLLLPMLSRGELQCIGATTLKEYQKHFEDNVIRDVTFQQVYYDLSVEDTVYVLNGLREGYERYHKVKISDAALVSAAVLADRYLTEENLPDKAIDLLDEAAAKLKLEITSKPTDYVLREEDVAEVVSKWTGLPLSSLQQ